MAVQNPPEGYTTVTPYLIVKGAREFLTFLEKAFDAKQRNDMMIDPQYDVVGHAEAWVGNSIVMFADEMDGFPATKTLMHVYVDDVDKTHDAAIAAGAISLEPPTDQFYGDRAARLDDAWGNQWYIAKHMEDVPPEEMAARMEAALAAAEDSS